MNWDFVKQVVEHKAHAYALQGGQHMKGSDTYVLRYNGYFAGYMENAAERESLRAILRVEEGKIKGIVPPLAGNIVYVPLKVSEPVDDKQVTLDDLV